MNDTPEKYILTSDFATLANDSNTVSISVAIPATSISPGSSQLYENTATVGVPGSPIEADINYSITSDRWSGKNLLFVENDGTSSMYQGLVSVYRDSPTAVRVSVRVFRFFSGSVTKVPRTVTVRVRSFVPPFS